MKPGAASDASGPARCFLALLPDAASRDAITSMRDSLVDSRGGGALHGLRWVDAASWHLTLRFLGATTTAQIEYLQHMLPTLASDLPACPGRRCAIWPNRARPRVLIMEIEAPAVLNRLANDCEVLARKCGFAPEPRAFRPHLTLARLRPGCTRDTPPLPTLRLRFDTLALMASDLQATGARYRSLASIALPAQA